MKPRGMQRRLIPACAGKTVTRRRPAVCQRAHPRVCGENPLFSLPFLPVSGSSPRVRGKPGLGGHKDFMVGLIPACAGKTPYSYEKPYCVGAHPRVCGENEASIPEKARARGSSPRVRGKPQGPADEKAEGGLIPACAGKTASPTLARSIGQAHPRVCGENDGARCEVVEAEGSSPRVRGKRDLLRKQRRHSGLIPACAGKTPFSLSSTVMNGAHPRVCGENRKAHLPRMWKQGSSPRVRGKRGPSQGRRPGQGLIPACAGKTPSPPEIFSRPPAHPRVCGENRVGAPGRRRFRGSSPRVRGKLSCEA